MRWSFPRSFRPEVWVWMVVFAPPCGGRQKSCLMRPQVAYLAHNFWWKKHLEIDLLIFTIYYIKWFKFINILIIYIYTYMKLFHDCSIGRFDCQRVSTSSWDYVLRASSERLQQKMQGVRQIARHRIELCWTPPQSRRWCAAVFATSARQKFRPSTNMN